MTEEQVSTLIDAFVALLVALIPIILAVATRSASQFLKTKGATLEKEGRVADLRTLQTVATLAIMAAEEIYATGASNEKKQYVQNRIWRESNNIGVPLSKNQVNLLLEGTLKAIKQEWPGFKETIT